jgi:hypothetical protein
MFCQEDCVDAEIAGLMEQAGPLALTALGAYGTGVLTRAEDTAVDATANLGQRILRAIWRRRDARGRAELEAAVRDAAAEPGDADAAGALRQQIKRALRDDPQLVAELATLLGPSHPAAVAVNASGERSVAAGGDIGIAVTGDGHAIGS